MWQSVRQFAADRRINGYDDLEANGYLPTLKQKANVLKRVNRGKNPVSFPDAWTDNFVSNKYGAATTHWEKLMGRVQRGVGNPCPLVLLGLPASMVRFDAAAIDVLEEEADEASPP
jgi:hypothetical protein